VKRDEMLNNLAAAHQAGDADTVERMLHRIRVGDEAREADLIAYARANFGRKDAYRVEAELQDLILTRNGLIQNVWSMYQDNRKSTVVQLLLDRYARRIAEAKAARLRNWAANAPLQPYEPTTEADEAGLFDVVTDDDRGEAPDLDQTLDPRDLPRVWARSLGQLPGH
jgi:hypothetical protein